eukprot:2320408-Pyramimonas_sp.AAC.1
MADAKSFATLDQLVTLQNTKFRPPPAASENLDRGGRDREGKPALTRRRPFHWHRGGLLEQLSEL